MIVKFRKFSSANIIFHILTTTILNINKISEGPQARSERILKFNKTKIIILLTIQPFGWDFKYTDNFLYRRVKPPPHKRTVSYDAKLHLLVKFVCKVPLHWHYF